jgi:exodeoxyribonuclease V gamma subunit
MVLHGNRMEDLRDLLTGFLHSQPLPVLQPVVILVQSNGMKHWLEIALADECALGICAATRMELPGAYLWQVYRAVLGPEAVPRQMVFDKARLLWRLVRLLPALAASDPVFAPLPRYLGQDGDGRRSYQLAQHIADVLDGYQSYRADWLSDWALGQDLLRDLNGNPLTLDPAQRWEPALCRAIRADVGAALADSSRASVHAQFMHRLQGRLQAYQATGESCQNALRHASWCLAFPRCPCKPWRRWPCWGR